jgi:hypothetical protein
MRCWTAGTAGAGWGGAGQLGVPYADTLACAVVGHACRQLHCGDEVSALVSIET